MSDELTISIQLKLDPFEPDAGAKARTLVDAVLTAASGSARVEVASNLGATEKTARKVLGPDELREVLQTLLTGADGNKPLNAGERTMLKMIAVQAGDPMPYENLNRALGSGAKFGNVSSGLARRFWSRGYELPYRPDANDTGYVMDPDVAEVTLLVVASDETPHDEE